MINADSLPPTTFKPICNPTTEHPPEETPPIVTRQAQTIPAPSSATEQPVDERGEIITPVDTVETFALDRLDEIASAIVSKKEQIAQNFVEIGYLLNEAKNQTDKGYGKWLPWLKQIGIHPRTAQIYMEIARAFPNTNSISRLGVAKAHALLALPEEERESFLNELHSVGDSSKNVSEMSVNAIKKAIKCRQKDNNETDAAKNEEEEEAMLPESTVKLDDQIKSAQKALASVHDYLFDQKNGPSLQEESIKALHSIRDAVNDCITLVESGKL